MPSATKQSNTSENKKPNPISNRITSAKVTNYLKMCIFGNSGAGKTTLWSSFPGKKLLLLCSSGKGELKSLSKKQLADVDQFVLDDPTEDLGIVLEAVRSGQYEYVILDHISEFCFLTMKHILNLAETPTSLGWGDARIQDYGTMKTQVSKFVGDILNEDINFLIIGQERLFTSDDDEFEIPDIVNVDATPGVVRFLNPAVDYTIHLSKKPKMDVVKKKLKDGKTIEKEVESKKMQYFARIGPNKVYYTKFRKPIGVDLPEEMNDPTGPKILELIKSLY